MGNPAAESVVQLSVRLVALSPCDMLDWLISLAEVLCPIIAVHLLHRSATTGSARRAVDGKLLLRASPAVWRLIYLTLAVALVLLAVAQRTVTREPGDWRYAVLLYAMVTGFAACFVISAARRWALVDGWGIVAQSALGRVQRIAWKQVTRIRHENYDIVIDSMTKQVRISTLVLGIEELLQEIRAHVPDHIYLEVIGPAPVCAPKPPSEALAAGRLRIR